MRKCCSSVVAVLVLGLFSVPAWGHAAPDVVISAVSSTGVFDDLGASPIEIGVGEFVDLEVNIDGSVNPATNVVALDSRFVISGGAGLNCISTSILNQALLGTCSVCSSNCGPPNPVFGLVDVSGGSQTCSGLCLAGEMQLQCKAEGTFTVGWDPLDPAATVLAAAPPAGVIIDIVNDPDHWKSITIKCFIPAGECCVGTDCVDSQCATASGTNAQTSEPDCLACGGTWSFDKDCFTPCLCASDADCDDGDACTDDVCNVGNGICSFPATAAAAACAAQSVPPCVTFACNAASGACDDLSSGNDGNACDDNSVCTDGDACLAGACVSGKQIQGQPCASDADCASANEDPDIGVCVGGLCECEEAPCLSLEARGSAGVNQTDQLCYDEGDQLTVDLEVGVSAEALCGVQICLAHDPCLTLKGIEADPDGETGMSQKLIEIIDAAASQITYAAALPIGTACGVPPGTDPTNGTLTGGTIARLTFASTCNCKSPGVFFRECNPPTKLGGANGDITPQCCGGSGIACPTGALFFEPDLSISCSGGATGNADCGPGNTAQICLDPVVIEGDKCGDVDGPNCTCDRFQACDSDLDCGSGSAGMCDQLTAASDCASGNCVDDPLANEFGWDGFCATGVCLGGFCTDASPCEFTAAELALGGCFQFGPGRTELKCDASNGCKDRVACGTNIANTGKKTLCIDLELSPKMVGGNKLNPIVRCIELDLSNCAEFFCDGGSAAGELCQPLNSLSCDGEPDRCKADTIHFQEQVVFGKPGNVAGHGSLCIKVPPQNWDCLVATAEGKSLPATCNLECADNKGPWFASYKGSKAHGDTCHWLVQGNLNSDEHIDVADFTILAAQYPSTTSVSKECKPSGKPNADFNGDGLVTLSDYTFIIVNFFQEEKDPCAIKCVPGAALEFSAPRSSITVRELVEMGLGEYVRAADVDGNGVVDLADMSRFLEKNAADDPALAADLMNAVDAINQDLSSAGLR